MTTDPVALGQFLTGLEWVVERTRREGLDPGQGLLLPGRRTCMVYIAEGALLLEGLAHDIGRRGDILLLTSLDASRLEAVERSRVVLVELRPAPGAESVAADLPRQLVVRDFAGVEPQMAALAGAMGSGCERVAAVGEGTVCNRIATVIIAVAMRTWSGHGCAPDEWLVRSSDPQLARALDAIHEDPAAPWTVADLATVATMSRSVFAERFRRALGRSPASYLTEVRVARAKRYLGKDGLSVGETSRRLGYGSEEGFSRAFSRHVGATPSQWRRAQLALAG